MDRLFFIACVLFLIKNSNCFPKESISRDKRSLGGKEISIQQTQYQVSIQTKGGYHFCGGSLIRLDIVLTAAHCFYNETERMFYKDTIAVVAGASLYKNTSVFYSDVNTIIIHELYDALTMENDIALLMLDKKIPIITSHINLIQLAGKRYPIDTHCTIAGWGIYTEESYAASDQLRQIDVYIKDLETCIETYKNVDTALSTNVICAGSLTTEIISDVCLGDSGGGLVCENELVGIVSQGHPDRCGVPDYHVVTTSVRHFTDWINTNIYVFDLASEYVNGYTTLLLLPIDVMFCIICIYLSASEISLRDRTQAYPTFICGTIFTCTFIYDSIYKMGICYAHHLNCVLVYFGFACFYLIRIAFFLYLARKLYRPHSRHIITGCICSSLAVLLVNVLDFEYLSVCNEDFFVSLVFYIGSPLLGVIVWLYLRE